MATPPYWNTATLPAANRVSSRLGGLSGTWTSLFDSTGGRITRTSAQSYSILTAFSVRLKFREAGGISWTRGFSLATTGICTRMAHVPQIQISQRLTVPGKTLKALFERNSRLAITPNSQKRWPTDCKRLVSEVTPISKSDRTLWPYRHRGACVT